MITRHVLCSCTRSSQAVEVIEEDSDGGRDVRLQSQRREAFLSLARFSDAQYQSIDKYMKSSEFENKQALLEKAKEEVGLIREHKVMTNRSVCLYGLWNYGVFGTLLFYRCTLTSQVHNKGAEGAAAG